MRRNGLALIAAAAVVGGAWLVTAQTSAREAANAAGVFTVDPIHSVVVFGIGHLGVSRMYGTFHQPTGTYHIDPANPSGSMIDISIDATKVDTGADKRDDHLRSPDFFNAKEFATITFKSASFTKSGEASMKGRGDLTMLGVTKPIEIDLEYLGEAETRQGYKSGFEARFSIKRSEFGMTKYLEQNALSDEVRLIVAVEGKRE